MAGLQTETDRTRIASRSVSGKKKGAGDDLLSHAASHAVPSALEGLTSEFGMGSGMALPVWSPAPYFGGAGLRPTRDQNKRIRYCDDLGHNAAVKARGQASRPISTTRLNALQRLHLWPINLVVSEGPLGTFVRDSWFWGRFPT